jgi:hypothetical protein
MQPQEFAKIWPARPTKSACTWTLPVASTPHRPFSCHMPSHTAVGRTVKSTIASWMVFVWPKLSVHTIENSFMCSPQPHSGGKTMEETTIRSCTAVLPCWNLKTSTDPMQLRPPVLTIPRFVLPSRLHPGALVIFDNRWVLHSRSGIAETDGERWSQSCHLNQDGVCCL